MTIQLADIAKVEPRRDPDSGPIVSINGLNAYFGNLQVLKDVSLNIEENQVLGIMGPSGCGKTTLIRILNRMNDDAPGFRRTGSVTIRGLDIYSRKVDPVMLKTRVGMVFQSPNPFPISIYENVAFGPKIHKIFRNKIELNRIVRASLERAGLWEEVKDR